MLRIAQRMIGCALAGVVLASVGVYGQGKKIRSESTADTYQVGAPHSHKNLSLYFITGPDKFDGSKYLTLQEALEKKVAVVHETSNVQKLFVENRSETMHLFIHAGDIIKGGKQDRVLPCDVVIKPKSGKMDVDSLCVEQGRWSRRGSESSADFSTSKMQIASRKMRLSAKHHRAQRGVWDSVARRQGKLSQRLGRSVQSQQSSSSLQLTREDAGLKKAVSEYGDRLSQALLAEKDNVVGFVFAVNGEINGAEIYGSSHLFRRLWSKLIDVAANEAIAEFDRDKQFDVPSVAKVKAFLESADSANVVRRESKGSLKLLTKESKKAVLLETEASKPAGDEDAVYHRSYIAK